mgnify:CR=1 FL=1
MTFDTRCTQPVPVQSRDVPSGAIVHAHSPKTRPRAGLFHLLPVGPEFNVIPCKPQVLLLSLAVTAALAACSGNHDAAQPADARAAPAVRPGTRGGVGADGPWADSSGSAPQA